MRRGVSAAVCSQAGVYSRVVSSTEGPGSKPALPGLQLCYRSGLSRSSTEHPTLRCVVGLFAVNHPQPAPPTGVRPRPLPVFDVTWALYLPQPLYSLSLRAL